LPVEATLARNAVLSSSQQLFAAQEQAKLAESELHQLTGVEPSIAIHTVEPQLENEIFARQEDVLYRKALESVPEILQSESTIRAKEFHIEAEKGENLPRADIIGQYALFSRTNNYADYFNRFSRNNFIIGFSFQIPIFNGFRTNSRVAQSRQEVLEAKYRAESLKSDLKLTIERGASALRIARGERRVASDHAEAAREMVKINEALLESGKLNVREMLDSRAQLLQKELAILESDRIIFQRKLELLRAVGSMASALQ
jgi:outer membrane protein